MHKNTFVFLTVLAIFAALVVGVNIGKYVAGSNNLAVLVSPTPNLIVSPTALPTPDTTQSYTNGTCGFSLNYPDILTPVDSPESTLILVNKNDENDAVIATCQKDIPRPSLPADKIEDLKIGSISAKLYHDASGKDGTPIDIVIFKHPKKPLDIYISGLGESFQTILKTITII